VATVLQRTLVIVKRPQHTQGFQVLQWRWIVESACKGLIQQRFKGVGMRWSEAGFNHLLHLRLAWVNGSFEALFQVQLQPSPNT